jgi:hypothetical protein
VHKILDKMPKLKGFELIPKVVTGVDLKKAIISA